MINFSRPSVPVVLEHWYVLIPDFEISTSEFYEAIEEDLRERDVPDLEIKRILHAEGSALSARREYLQLRRERLLFEVCSARFGTAWFFSCRFGQIPIKLKLWQVAVILAGAGGFFLAFAFVFGFFFGTGLFILTLLGIVYLLKAVMPLGMFSLDERLCRFPVIGPFYELFLRSKTYYREDTRLMYCDLMNRVVRSQVEEFAGKNDVKNLEFKHDESMANVSIFDLLKKIGSSLWAGSKKI